MALAKNAAIVSNVQKVTPLLIPRSDIYAGKSLLVCDSFWVECCC